VTGLHVAINSPVTYSIEAVGNQLQSVHMDVPTAAPSNILTNFGILSFAVKTPVVGGTATVRITASSSFGNNPQFYQVNQAGKYVAIALANVAVVAPNIIDLMLADGGPLDLDGIANGIIVDPIAVGSTPKILGGSGGGGGCTIASANDFDPMMPALLLLACLYLLQRRRQPVQR